MDQRSPTSRTDTPPEPVAVDYLVIGGGPAGLQLGYFLQRSGRDYLILERGSGPGEFFKTLPRHRKLISINKIHTGYDDPEINLRWDWNSLLDDGETRFRDYSERYFPHADTLVRYLEDYAETHDLAMRCGVEVTRVSRHDDGRFRVATDDGGTYVARRLVVATGVSRPWVPDIPGIELAENYVDVPVDPQDFAGQRVLLLGKGNSSFELADPLIATTSLIHVASPKPIRMAWKTHHVGDLRAINNNLLDTYQLKSQNAVLDASIEAIERDGDEYRVTVSYSHAEGEREVLTYDRVIAATGFRFDASIFDESCRPRLAIEDRFPDQTAAWESVNVDHLYVAGTLMQVRDYKKVTSSFIHGFRYNLRSLNRLFGLRYHGEAWPSRPLDADPESLVDAILERVNRSSALWQQFGFLGDVVRPEGDGSARYFEELPVQWVPESEPFAGREHLVVTLEFGKIEGDPFQIDRFPEPGMAERSTFLHPVVRHWVDGEMVDEIHLLENLYGEWKDDELHRRPLVDFVTRRLASRVGAA